MSTEFISSCADPTPVNPESGPSTGSWRTHTSTGDAEGQFPDMDAESDIDRISIVDTLCMNCQEEGVTRFLLTKIPYFREIVVMSFACPHCNARHAEIQPANDLQDKACRITLTVIGASDPVATKHDLNRQVIKSETCTILIPELEFEIPPNTKRGDINTVEGVLTNIADSLSAEQANREIQEPEKAQKIQVIIDKFRSMASGSSSFTLILDDLAGNSFLENPMAPSKDERAAYTYYARTREQTIELGYAVEENKSEIESMEVVKGEEAKKKIVGLFGAKKGAAADGSASSSSSSAASSSSSSSALPSVSEVTGRGVTVAAHLLPTLDTYFNVSDRSATMTGPCTACSNPEAETRMCVTDVPHFKDVVLLVTQCEMCGYRDAEVKPMGRVSKRGRKITLRVTSIDDLKRDLLKSDTASCMIPELELELQSGTLGGKYTTLEGMLGDIQSQLSRSNPFSMGDSSEPEKKDKMRNFLDRLEELSEVKTPWTFILDCPLGNCFIFSPLGDADPNLKVERYDRTFEQDEELGLNDIDVDDYMTEEQRAEMEADMKAEEETKKLEKEMEEATLRSNGQATPTAPTTAERDAARMVALKASKIGGMISVDSEDEEEEKKATTPAVASSSSSSSAPQKQ
eukprot:TRINITY_DN12875_c0_g1_i1.p1 TRINITY_DN12875_c0_g1~~TRINITY_DN12875_c0_g1_i1.p1  ORF type:complete len:632 (-),score=69.16 TRINITY_DN12875_c0_g1_i1:171-2066(-)